MPDERCATCRFARDYESSKPYCCRFPPRPCEDGFGAYWPHPHRDDWCGEWQKREERPNA